VTRKKRRQLAGVIVDSTAFIFSVLLEAAAMGQEFQTVADAREQDDPGAWWKVLGVPANASVAQAKEAYRRLVKRYHPDKGGNAVKFLAVNRAWQEFQKTTKI